MIQPSALSIVPAPSPVTTIPMAVGDAGDTGESRQIDAGFAALLGIQLEATAGTAEPAPANAIPVPPEMAAAKISPDGNALPDTMLTVLTIEVEESGPKISDDIEIAPLTALPVIQAALPAQSAAHALPPSPEDGPAPSAMRRASPAALALSAPILSRAGAKAEPATPTAENLPNQKLAVAGDKPGAVPAEPVRTFTAPPQVEASSTPAAIFQPLTAPQVMAVPTTSQPHARHDFTALIDRLVEARDAALTVQTSQTISAAVTHSEFGEVSIRFQHAGDALSVSLASADPDFARAIQAAAPAAQANTAGDNSAQPQRQEGSGQQLAPGSGSSHQSQPQQRQGGGGTRSAVQQERDAEQKQPAHGGIFA